MKILKTKKDLGLPQLLKDIIRLFGCNPDNFKLGDDIYSKISDQTGIDRNKVKREIYFILYS